MTRSAKREDGAGDLDLGRKQFLYCLLPGVSPSGPAFTDRVPSRVGPGLGLHFPTISIKTHASMSDRESAPMADATAAVHPCTSRAEHPVGDQPEPREALVHAPDPDGSATSEPQKTDEGEEPSSLASGIAASTQDALQHSQETEPVTANGLTFNFDRPRFREACMISRS